MTTLTKNELRDQISELKETIRRLSTQSNGFETDTEVNINQKEASDVQGSLEKAQVERDEFELDLEEMTVERDNLLEINDILQKRLNEVEPAVELLCKLLNISENDWNLLSGQPNALELAKEWGAR